ncbi:hypothetical protein Leryth_026349 [Lithospermum erythrorhizon]|nr:hypothetical protein Leryth_026349 [Lithospermum erythrorhizon]
MKTSSNKDGRRSYSNYNNFVIKCGKSSRIIHVTNPTQ